MGLASLWIVLVVLVSGQTDCPSECHCGEQRWSCEGGLRRVPNVDEGVLAVTLRGCLMRVLTDRDMERLATSVLILDLTRQRGVNCVMDARKKVWPTTRILGLCAVSFLYVFFKKKNTFLVLFKKILNGE